MATAGPRPPAARLAVIGGLSSFGPLSLDLYLPALPQVATTLHTSDGAAQLSVSCCPWPARSGSASSAARRPVRAAAAAAGRCRPVDGGRAAVRGGAQRHRPGHLAADPGVGGAAGPVLARAVVRDLYNNQALARAFAVVALIANVTPAVAPVAGGVLLHVMSWRGLFLVLTGAGPAAAGWHRAVPAGSRSPRTVAKRRGCAAPSAWSGPSSLIACSSGPSARSCWPARCCSSTSR